LFSLLYSSESSKKLVLPFHVVSWGLPLILVSFAAGFYALGADLYFDGIGWCWIAAEGITWPKGDRAQLFWQFVAGKGIELISYILIPGLYIASRHTLHASHQQKTLLLQDYAREALQEADRKLAWVPILFLGLRIWGTLRLFLSKVVDGSGYWFWLALLQGVGDSGQGGANCFLFCFMNPRIRDSLKNFFCGGRAKRAIPNTSS